MKSAAVTKRRPQLPGLALVPPRAPKELPANVVDLRSWAQDHDYDDAAQQIEFHAVMRELERLRHELFPQMEDAH